MQSLLGLQPRGVYLSDRIVAALHQELPADQSSIWQIGYYLL